MNFLKSVIVGFGATLGYILAQTLLTVLFFISIGYLIYHYVLPLV